MDRSEGTGQAGAFLYGPVSRDDATTQRERRNTVIHRLHRLTPIYMPKAVDHAKPQRTPRKSDNYRQQCRHRLEFLRVFASLREMKCRFQVK
jgi:hypothetical protein